AAGAGGVRRRRRRTARRCAASAARPLKTCSAAVRAVGHRASWRGRFERVTGGNASTIPAVLSSVHAPVAHSDRALGFEPRGGGFESLRARQPFSIEHVGGLAP